MAPSLDEISHDVWGGLAERPTRVEPHQLVGMRHGIACDHRVFADLLCRNIFELALYRLGAHVLVAQTERPQRQRIDPSPTIDGRHGTPFPFDCIQQRCGSVGTVVVSDTVKESAAQVIVTDADRYHCVMLSLRKDGPVGFDPFAVPAVRARFRVTQDAAGFFDQCMSSGFGSAFDVSLLCRCISGLALFGCTLLIDAMTLAQGAAEIIARQAFDYLTCRHVHGGQIED